MIIFDFKISDNEIASEIKFINENGLPKSMTDEHVYLKELTSFYGGLKLEIDGKDMFWLEPYKKASPVSPLLGVAINLKHILNNLIKSKVYEYNVPEGFCTLVFELVGKDKIKIASYSTSTSNHTNLVRVGPDGKKYFLVVITSIVNKIELESAINQFLIRLRDLFISRIPILQQHPAWNEWFGDLNEK